MILSTIIKFLKKSRIGNKYLLPGYYFFRYRQNITENIRPEILKRTEGCSISIQGTRKVVLVPYIETYFEKLFVLVFLFKALQLRGAEIYFLTCNKALPRCEAFSTRTPRGRCKDCEFVHKSILSLLGFRVIEVRDFVSQHQLSELTQMSNELSKEYPTMFKFLGVDITPLVEDSLIRYYYGDVVRGPEFDENLQKYILTALISTQCAKNIADSVKPEVVVSHMFAYSEFQPYNLFFEQEENTSVRCIKGNPQHPDTANINIMDIYFSDQRFNAYKESRTQKYLTGEEAEELNLFISSRFAGKTYDFVSTGYFADGDDERRISELNIDPSKKNVFLFTNVEWDVGLKDCVLLFDGVMDWVLQTIETVKDQDHIHLYIKTHPDETFGVGSKKSIADKIREKFPILPDNVSLITPELKIKPYSLFPYIDLGVVFFGTLGLEMALKNIPVVITAIAHYGRKGFVKEPKSLAEYREILLREDNETSIDHDLLNLYAYFYFIKTNIPLNLTDKFYGFDPQKISYRFDSISDLEPGKDPYLDHICNCILEGALPEAW